MNFNHALLYRATGDPSDRDPLDKDPVDRDPPPPGRNMGPGSQTGSDIMQRPLAPMGRITYMCKNITLLQVSFEGGNKQES